MLDTTLVSPEHRIRKPGWTKQSNKSLHSRGSSMLKSLQQKQSSWPDCALVLLTTFCLI
jgi:hypothetical protein